jgi:histone acetyltransferase 1
LSDLAVQQLVVRIQALVPMFIEGGTLIPVEEEDEPSLRRWTVFFLYRKVETSTNASPYTFVGWSTVYRYYLYRSSSPAGAEIRHTGAELEFPFPEKDIDSLPCRSRISQFIILPPYQNAGHGARLYNTIFEYYLESAATVEITVEDPNEAFDDLRDLNDLTRLRKVLSSSPDSLKINTSVKVSRNELLPTHDIVPVATIDKLRTDLKIAPRQMARIVEMYLLAKIPSSVRQILDPEAEEAQKAPDTPESKAHKHEYHLWQLFTKQRLYKHNRDTLIQLEPQERIEKLDQALHSVEADYARLLSALDAKAEKAESSNAKKRGLEAEDEPAAKKTKVSEA